MSHSLAWRLADSYALLEGLQGAMVFTTTRAAGIQEAAAKGPLNVRAVGPPPGVREGRRPSRREEDRWESAWVPSQERGVRRAREVVERQGMRPATVVGMEQVHGGRVCVVTDPGDAELPACDGLVSGTPDVALTMRSADCLPIIAYDPCRRVIGLAHAGWRGMAARLPGQLVCTITHAFGGVPKNLRVGLGPRIGPCCYAVGSELHRWFSSNIQMREGRRFLDLTRVATTQLCQAGVPAGQIVPSPWCTACSPALWFSYRRDGPQTGRLVTGVMMTSH